MNPDQIRYLFTCMNLLFMDLCARKVAAEWLIDMGLDDCVLKELAQAIGEDLSRVGAPHW